MVFKDYFWCIFITAGISCYQVLTSYACRLEKKASNIAIIYQSQTFFSFVLDWLVLGHRILLINVIGAVIVAVCGVLIVISKEIKNAGNVIATLDENIENIVLELGSKE